MNIAEITSTYGAYGLDVLSNIQARDLKMTFNSTTKIFTLTGSSSLEKAKVNAIFKQVENEVWKPMLCERASLEDYTFQLVESDPYDYEIKIRRPGETDRHFEARKIVAIMQEAMSIELEGKQVIDVGCRSCENTIVMAEAGAAVVGIDPDSTEFVTNGKIELAQATLQEYVVANPDKRFDLATVFLWNINREKEEFVKSLASIIEPNGQVIIGWVDDEYDSLPSLIKAAFGNVKYYKFRDTLNCKMVKCSRPKR